MLLPRVVALDRFIYIVLTRYKHVHSIWKHLRFVGVCAVCGELIINMTYELYIREQNTFGCIYPLGALFLLVVYSLCIFMKLHSCSSLGDQNMEQLLGICYSNRKRNIYVLYYSLYSSRDNFLYTTFLRIASVNYLPILCCQ